MQLCYFKKEGVHFVSSGNVTVHANGLLRKATWWFRTATGDFVFSSKPDSSSWVREGW